MACAWGRRWRSQFFPCGTEEGPSNEPAYGAALCRHQLTAETSQVMSPDSLLVPCPLPYLGSLALYGDLATLAVEVSSFQAALWHSGGVLRVCVPASGHRPGTGLVPICSSCPACCPVALGSSAGPRPDKGAASDNLCSGDRQSGRGPLGSAQELWGWRFPQQPPYPLGDHEPVPELLR